MPPEHRTGPSYMSYGVVACSKRRHASPWCGPPHGRHLEEGNGRVGSTRMGSCCGFGLDLVCHLAMSCTNTEKQLFTVDYTLSVPINALDCRGHRRGAGL